jgi:hypothetical protein
MRSMSGGSPVLRMRMPSGVVANFRTAAESASGAAAAILAVVR